ncbi:hypothetical protein EJ03DRAFT_92038 [Teratosphaeria nubilosa]|uniref:Uncharacterized protein n=1 Tax=Teratosphaeria nubilosa TaxID=161662 RepID=A0A6G1L997_9PEZI|nr:hypothetical protein EJ03DRAFT_92038 [Teratosphaeria nubilosa]
MSASHCIRTMRLPGLTESAAVGQRLIPRKLLTMSSRTTDPKGRGIRLAAKHEYRNGQRRIRGKMKNGDHCHSPVVNSQLQIPDDIPDKDVTDTQDMANMDFRARLMLGRPRVSRPAQVLVESSGGGTRDSALVGNEIGGGWVLPC